MAKALYLVAIVAFVALSGKNRRYLVDLGRSMECPWTGKPRALPTGSRKTR
jgi:hypothetical protein